MQIQAATPTVTNASIFPSVTSDNKDSEKNAQTGGRRENIEDGLADLRQKTDDDVARLIDLKTKIVDDDTRLRAFRKSMKIWGTIDLLAVISSIVLFCFISRLQDPTDARLRWYQLIVMPLVAMHTEINYRLLSSTYTRMQLLPLWLVFGFVTISIVLHTVFTVQDIQWADQRRQARIELISAQNEVMELLRQWRLSGNSTKLL